jgi:hypothetical protein
LAKNCKIILKGKDMTKDEREHLVKESAVSAGVAGIVHLII